MKTKAIAAIAVLLILPEAAFAQGAPPPPPVVAVNAASASSWLAGAQVGYNWQRGSVVYGLEGDISGLDLSSQMNTTLLRNQGTPNPTAFATSSVDWYGTIRGRLGWATGPWMVYGTGGLAYGHTSLNGTFSDNALPFTVTSGSSRLKTGWVAGLGAEYLLRPNVILNVGYQYVDLGSTRLVGTSADGSLRQTLNAHSRFQVVSAGISWLFPPAGGSFAMMNEPKYAKAPYAKAPLAPVSPWEGLYTGGHVGGAWGNRSDASYSDANTVPPSDIRLKRDIVLVGRRDDGLGLYSYRYLWSDVVYVGVMAQEVALIRPDAIVRGQLDDYLRVDYSRLGLRLTSLSEWQGNVANPTQD